MEKTDQDLVTKMIADAIKPVSDQLDPLAKNVKVLADTLAADAKAKADAQAQAKSDADAKAKADADAKAKEGAAKTDDKPLPLTAEAVSKLVSDGIAAANKAQADAQKSTAAREAYIADKLKNVPAVYQAKLGADPSKWAAEEQTIRDALKADLAAIGATVKEVTGGNAGGASGAGSATADEKITQYKASGLSDGQADFAANMVMPA